MRSRKWRPLDRLYLLFFSWTMLGLVLAPFVLTIVTSVRSAHIDHAGRVITMCIYLAVLGVGAIVLRRRFKAFKCPGCGSTFDPNIWRFRKSCASCRLQIYAEH
jgi:tellurite resistance protein TehA-like permease